MLLSLSYNRILTKVILIKNDNSVYVQFFIIILNITKIREDKNFRLGYSSCLVNLEAFLQLIYLQMIFIGGQTHLGCRKYLVFEFVCDSAWHVCVCVYVSVC